MIVYLICVSPGIESYVSLPLESTEETYWNRPHQLNKKGPSYHVSGKKTSANPQHLRLLVPLKSTEEKAGSPMTPLSENVSNRDTEDLGFSPITNRKPTLILVSNARELGDKKDNQINSPTYWTQATGQVWFGRVKDDNKISSSFDMVILAKNGQKATNSIQNAILDLGKWDSEELVWRQLLMKT